MSNVRLALAALWVLSSVSACGSSGSGQPDAGGVGNEISDDSGSNVPIVSCRNGAGSMSGVVYAPNAADPVPNAIVYVSAAPPGPLAAGVRCETCTSERSINALIRTDAAYDGRFTLETVCAGPQTLVIQTGRFRRVVELEVIADQHLALTSDQTRLPRFAGEQHPEDTVPRFAVVTGDYDKMECVLHKMGLDRRAIDLYEGALFLASPQPLKSLSALVNDANLLKQYNIIFINCSMGEWEWELAKPNVRANLEAYIRSGGRLYVTDLSYGWIEQVEVFAPMIDFEPGPSTDAPEPRRSALLGADGLVVLADIHDDELSQWLRLFPGRADLDNVPIQHFLGDWAMMHAISGKAKQWVSGVVSSLFGGIHGERPLTVTFDYEGCGKVLFSSYHTEGRENEFFARPFPVYCGMQDSPQERILEFLIFNMVRCVGELK